MNEFLRVDGKAKQNEIEIAKRAKKSDKTKNVKNLFSTRKGS